MAVEIDLKVPAGWAELTDAQLRRVYRLMAAGLTGADLTCRLLIEWAGLTLVGRQPSGDWVLRYGDIIFEYDAADIAVMTEALSWLAEVPRRPVRPARLAGRHALPADFMGVPFESFIVCDNLYQGYLQTNDPALLAQMAEVLYPPRRRWRRRALKLTQAEGVAVFYWFAGLKAFFARRYRDFFRPASEAEDGALAAPRVDAAMLQERMDAQIRALTKGDVTKETEILAIDTWRALAELNALAREYKQLSKQIKK